MEVMFFVAKVVLPLTIQVTLIADFLSIIQGVSKKPNKLEKPDISKTGKCCLNDFFIVRDFN